MFYRFCLRAMLLACLVLPIASCSNTGLSYIKIAPTSVTLTVGQSVQFTAWGYYGNSKSLSNKDITSTVTWAYSTTSLVPCSVAYGTTTATPGCFTAIAPGVSEIGATATGFGGSVGDTATVTVNACTTGCGTVSSTATLTAITIIPGSQTVASPGLTGQFLAVGSFSDGSTQDLTSSSVWSSSSAQIATVGTGATNPGLATAVSQGVATITAKYTTAGTSTAIIGTATFTVSSGTTTTNNPTISSLAIIPGSQTVATPGQTGQFTAVGTYSDGSTKDLTSTAAWSSSSAQIATVGTSGTTPTTTPGLATAVSQGSATITAKYTPTGTTTVVIGTATFTVTSGNTTSGTPTIASLAVVPKTQSVAYAGQTASFIAIGTFSDGSTQDLTNNANTTWNSSSTQIASFNGATSNAALITANSQGSITVTAEYKVPATGTSSVTSVVTATAAFTVVGGVAEPYTALSLSPISLSLSASGQQGQLMLLGTSGTTGLQEDLTNSASVTWSSSVPTIASVTSGLGSTGNGLVKGLAAGSTTITAKWTNPTDNSTLTSSATAAVTATAAPEPLISLTIIPSTITVENLQLTAQFLAIGTYSTAPYTRDLTNSPLLTWISSTPNLFPVNSNTAGDAGATAGIVTADGDGTAVIIAEVTNPGDGTIQTATATFNCPLVLPTATSGGSCYPGSEEPELLATVTIYNEGVNSTNWLVTGPSATGTADVIHCGPGWTAEGNTGGSVCVGTYPVGSTVTLTATQPAGATGTFGGWSYNCTPTATVTAAGPNSCTVIVGDYDSTTKTYITSNVAVGAIFN
jgi:hypothetical protein